MLHIKVMKIVKKFRYDTVLSADEICNLEDERDALLGHLQRRDKVIVYGPRNYGKTSLVKSVIIPEFRKQHKKSFVFFVDLMQVRNQAALDLRMSKAFEFAFAKSFPTKSLLENAKSILSSLRPTIDFDGMTGEPSVSLNLSTDRGHEWWAEILMNIRENLAKEYPCLLIFDEFQDLTFVDGAEGTIRNILQEIL